MTLLQIAILALIQGLTEFLPISSSAHLILGSRVFSWPDQGLVFDVATHAGTLLAVLVYFRKNIAEMVAAWTVSAETQTQREQRAMGKYLLFASLPVIVVGVLAHGRVEAYLRDVNVIAATTLVFGALLWFADARFSRSRILADMRLKPALVIGVAQVLALIPGVSRSGITITAGRMLGFSADASARFSFLVAIPVIAAAGIYGFLRMLFDDAELDWSGFVLAVLFSALAGWICITAFLALLKRIGLFPFVVYRLALGVVLMFLAL